MLLKTKLLLSLGTLGVAGGTGTGVYLLQRKSEDKTFQKEEKFSGSLVFEQKNKDSDENKKIYQAKLSENKNSNIKDKECKFESDVLTCKVSNLVDKEIANKYLNELNKKLENLISENVSELPKKLKQTLEEKDDKFETIFGSEIYESMKLKLPSTT